MTSEEERVLSDFVHNNIGCNQTALVEECLTKEVFAYDDIANLYQEGEGGEEEAQEIFSWYCVDEWMADKLKEQGEPVLENDFGKWWGRTTFGQLIAADSVIERIHAELNK
jgi:hypothetical protein